MSVSNILVPVDFSETSKTATKLAIEWSNILQCNLTLVHNYRLISDVKNANQSPRTVREAIVADKLKSFERFEKEVDFSKAHSVTTKLELGFTVDSIKRMAAQDEIDLIIYGIKSKNLPHSTDELVKIMEVQLAPILIVHGNHEVDTEESFSELENKIMTFYSDDFIEGIERYLSELDMAPNQSFLIHPSITSSSQIKSSDSSIADRIINFSKTN